MWSVSGGTVGRRELLAGLGTVASALAAACRQGQPAPAAQPAKPVTVTFFSPASDQLGDEIMRDLVLNQFQSEYPSIKVDYVFTPTDNNYEKYVAAIVSGNSPDVIMTYTYTPVPGWAFKELIQPLDQYRTEMKIRQEDYFANVWEMIFFNGHLWGFLQEFDANLYCWNKDTLAKEGIDPNKPPRTIEEMDALSAAVTKRDESGALSQVGIVPWSHGGTLFWTTMHGGSYYDFKNGKFTILTPQSIATLEWFAGWVKRYGGIETVNAFNQKYNLTARTSFYNGQTPLTIQGEYRPIVWQREAPQVQTGVAFTPTAPGVTYGTGQTGGGNVFVLPQGAPHRDQGVVLMKWLASPKAVWEWCVRENNLPPVKAIAFDPKFAEAVPLMKPWLEMLRLDKMMPVISHPLVATFNSKLSQATTRVITGEMSPRDSLRQMETEMNIELEQLKR